jgi:hypothetical protein
MRLSATDAWKPKGALKVAETMAECGYYTRLGSWITACDAEYPWDPGIVKQIRREFDPAWTPLFCREAWMAPGTKGIVTIGRHMVARYVPIPHSETDILKVSCLPLRGSYAGVSFKAPLLEAMTLELRSAPDKVEQDAGGMVRKELGEYVAFDNRVYLTCKAIWHQNHSKRAKDIAKEIVWAQVEKPKEESAKAMSDLRDTLKDEWPRLERIRQAETEYDRQKAWAEGGLSLSGKTMQETVGKSSGKYAGH